MMRMDERDETPANPPTTAHLLYIKIKLEMINCPPSDGTFDLVFLNCAICEKLRTIRWKFKQINQNEQLNFLGVVWRGAGHRKWVKRK